MQYKARARRARCARPEAQRERAARARGSVSANGSVSETAVVGRLSPPFAGRRTTAVLQLPAPCVLRTTSSRRRRLWKGASPSISFDQAAISPTAARRRLGGGSAAARRLGLTLASPCFLASDGCSGAVAQWGSGAVGRATASDGAHPCWRASPTRATPPPLPRSHRRSSLAPLAPPPQNDTTDRGEIRIQRPCPIQNRISDPVAFLVLVNCG